MQMQDGVAADGAEQRADGAERLAVQTSMAPCDDADDDEICGGDEDSYRAERDDVRMREPEVWAVVCHLPADELVRTAVHDRGEEMRCNPSENRIRIEQQRDSRCATEQAEDEHGEHAVAEIP